MYDEITATNMNNLRAYINKLSTAWQIGTSLSIASINAGTSASSELWDAYANKANALPHVSGLARPAVGDTINASYYNSYVTKINP